MDFTKLLNRTPEERQADIERAQREYDEGQDQLLATRKANLEAALSTAGLTPRDRDFLQGLQSRARQVDHVGGRDGGRLLYISEPQVEWLKRLAARALKPKAEAPAGANDIFARMTRSRRHAPLASDDSDERYGGEPAPRS